MSNSINNRQNIMFLLLILIFIPVLTNGQKILKSTNTIYVKDVSFKSAKKSILDSNYIVEQQNENDGMLIVKKFNGKKFRMYRLERRENVMLIYIRIADSIAKINANYSFIGFKKMHWNRVKISKLKTGLSYHLFMQMDKLARSLGTEIKYSTE